jgi:hypothetical protein
VNPSRISRRFISPPLFSKSRDYYQYHKSWTKNEYNLIPKLKCEVRLSENCEKRKLGYYPTLGFKIYLRSAFLISVTYSSLPSASPSATRTYNGSVECTFRMSYTSKLCLPEFLRCPPSDCHVIRANAPLYRNDAIAARLPLS